MNSNQIELLRAAKSERDAAPHGERGAVLERYAALLGLANGKGVSRLLKEQFGRTRSVRSDANKTAYTRHELEMIAGALQESRRKSGKAMWPVSRAIDVLHASGELSVKLSPSRVLVVLRKNFLHPDQLGRPSPAVKVKSAHPNEVWQMDASICVLYRTAQGEIEQMEREEFYKNKLHNVAKVMHDLVVRYVATDHTSGAIAVRYFIGAESTENALEFFMWLICERKDSNGRGLPFWGVPFNLYTDQGSAFKSGPFENFCQMLDVKLTHHAPRNARATGQVENAQNLVERGLEGMLRFIDRAELTIERLNLLADEWMAHFNGAVKHERHKMTRYGAWSHITAQQLRKASGIDELRSLPASKPVPRKVDSNLQISFALKGVGARHFDVRDVPGIAVGETVLVAVNPYRIPAVKVRASDATSSEWTYVDPIERDFWGFDAGATRFGEFRAMPNTPIEESRNAIARRAYGEVGKPASLDQAERARRNNQVPYRGQFNPRANFEGASPVTYLPKPGVAHTPAAEEDAAAVPPCPATVEVLRLPDRRRREFEWPVLTWLDIGRRAIDKFGRGRQHGAFYGWARENFPDGASEKDLPAVLARAGAEVDEMAEWLATHVANGGSR